MKRKAKATHKAITAPTVDIVNVLGDIEQVGVDTSKSPAQQFDHLLRELVLTSWKLDLGADALDPYAERREIPDELVGPAIVIKEAAAKIGSLWIALGDWRAAAFAPELKDEQGQRSES